MTQTKAITDAITTLTDVENRFEFIRIEDELLQSYKINVYHH